MTLTTEWRVPWNVVEIAEEVQILVETTNTQVEYTCREANQLADYIANTTIQKKSIQ